MVTNVAYEMQTSKAFIIGFDTPAVIQTSCEPLENLVATRAAQRSVPPIPGKERRGHGGGSRRDFRQFICLGVGSVKAAFSRPAHQYPEGA